MKYAIVLISIYLIGWLGTAGAMNANSRCRFTTLATDPRWTRNNLSFEVGWSMFPVIPWLVAPFESGFYYDGWTLSGSPIKQGECR